MNALQNLLAKCHRSHFGMTLIEVMIALTVLSIAVLGILGNYAGQQVHQRINNDRDVALAVARQLMERISVIDTAALGNATLAPWSVSRYAPPESDPHWQPGDALPPGVPASLPGSQPPMTQTATANADNLLMLGLLPARVGLDGLRVSVEYYRGLSQTVGGVVLPGLMDAFPVTDDRDWSSQFGGSEAAYRTFLRSAELSPQQDISSQVEEVSPIVIRVVVDWLDAGTRFQQRQRLEFFTSRRRESAQ